MGARPGARRRRPVAARDRARGRRARGPGRDRDSLYAGIAGLAPVLAEIAPAPAADRRRAGARRHGIVRAAVDTGGRRTEPSLYDGLAGDATALRLLAPGPRDVALERLARADDPGRLARPPDDRAGPDAPLTDSSSGTAGIVLAAVWAGGEHAADDRDHRRRGPAARSRTAPRPAWTGGWCRDGRAGARTTRTAPPASPPRWPSPARRWAARTSSRPRSGRPAPARRGLAGRRRVRRAAHDPAVRAGGGAGHLHLVPRAGRHLAPVRGAGPRRRRRGRRARASPTCARGACTRSSPPASRSASAPGSGTTTAAAAAPRASGDVLLDAAQDAATRRGPTRCSPLPARWATPSSSGRSATRPAPAGGSSSTARTRRCCRPAPPGCRAPPASPRFLLRLARVVEDGPTLPVVDRPDQWWAVPARLRTVHAVD